MTLRHRFTHETSCGCAIIRDGPKCAEILLVQPYELSAWGIPKGHVEYRETFEKCAIREVKEETGLDVQLLALVPKKYVMETFGMKKTVWCFVAEPKGSDVPTKNEENFDVKWWPVDSLPRIHVYQRGIVQDALAALESEVPQFPEDILLLMEATAKALGTCEDWVTIKNHIVAYVTSYSRPFFCKRIKHRHHVTNFFEDEMREWWRHKTGVLPEIPHDMRGKR